MRRTNPSRSSAFSTLLLGSAVLAASCVDNGLSVFIRQVNAPVAAGTNGCTLNNDSTGMRIFEGQLDLSLREGYVLSPLIQNEILTRADPTSNRTSAQYSVIEGFVIEVHDSAPDGPLIGRAFTVYQTVVLPPSIAGTPGYVSTQIQVIPPAITRQLTGVCQVDMAGVTADCPVPRFRSNDRRLIVRISAFGHTNGGVEITTPTFDFPVNVCCHCLVRFPPEANMAETAGAGGAAGPGAGPDCLAGAAIMDNATCSPGQDYSLDCRSCSTGNATLNLTAIQLCQPRGFRLRPNVECPLQ